MQHTTVLFDFFYHAWCIYPNIIALLLILHITYLDHPVLLVDVFVLSVTENRDVTELFRKNWTGFWISHNGDGWRGMGRDMNKRCEIE